MTSVIAGALGGAGCTVLLQPLETLKTRRQLYLARHSSETTSAASSEAKSAGLGEKKSTCERHVLQGTRTHVGNMTPSSSSSSSSSFRTPVRPPSYAALARQVIASDGVFGLWAGLNAGLWRTVPGVGLYFGALGLLRPRRPNWEAAAHPLHNVLAGAAARGMVAALLLPLTVVKARMESGRYGYRGVPSALVVIARGEGVRGLFCGMGATLARDAPFSGLYLALYERLKPPAEATARSLKVPVAIAHLGAGLAAGGVVSLATHPFDVAKTWLQVGEGPVKAAAAQQQQQQQRAQPPRKTLPMLAFVVRHEGFAALWRGAAPRVLRRSLIAAINWTIFEELVAAVDRFVYRI
jgi:solute carrier family 25 protein 38